MPLTLVMTLLLTLTLFSPFSSADKLYLSPNDTVAVTFYRQLRANSAYKTDNGNKSLLARIMPDQVFLEPLTNQKQADDLAFNYLWLQQQQQGYSQKNGGAAAGKLLRMGIKSLYKSYSGSSSINIGDESDFVSSIHNVDYRLRLSSDKIKLGIEYEF
ncbi:hypothetical protein [uncultured Oceanicoccus sp.]|uniref:hypothetical protein n=1 Tax=uncultured Oceanicoccus sp. TaxID=1706381 RepID=UPI0030D74A2C